MTVFVDCYDKDGKQLMGMSDGQTVINAKQYKRTKAYKNAKKNVGNGRVFTMKFVSITDEILEVISVETIERGWNNDN